jgi:hypothetical protein
MQGSNQKESSIVRKATCTLCRRFFGFIRADGTSPEFDSCPHTPAARTDNATVKELISNGKYDKANRLVKKLGLTPPECPMEKQLASYQPKPKNLTPGGALNSGSGHRKGTVPPDDNDQYFSTD